MEVNIVAQKEVLDRALYKKIKAMDRKNMEAFLNEMYAVGAESVNVVNVDVDAYVEEHGLKQVNDEGALRATVEKVIADNPQSVADYRAGKEKAIGFLVGQTMKATQGKANPQMINKILNEILNK